MAAYEFVALAPDGRFEQGLTEADSERQARRQLRERGLTPVSVTHARSSPKRAGPRGYRLEPAELALLTRLLSTLLASGMPLDDALLALSRQTGNRASHGLVLEVRAGILEGKSLEKSMAPFERAFPDTYRATVGAGEQTRHLPAVLARLADHVDAAARAREKLRAALIYPAVVTLTAILVVSGLVTFVVPEVTRVFDSVDRELPLVTRVLLALSDGASAWGGYVLMALVLGWVGFRRALRRRPFRAAFQGVLMRTPLVGALLVESATAQFARTLAVLVDTGVSLLDSLRIAARTAPLVPLADDLAECASAVQEGVALSAALGRIGYLPPLLPHLVASGENSGDVAGMLDTAAATLEHKTSNALTVAVSLLEPALILSMGAVVLFIVLAILLPIFDMNQLI